jgi:hypothetical protein
MMKSEDPQRALHYSTLKRGLQRDSYLWIIISNLEALEQLALIIAAAKKSLPQFGQNI